MSLVFVTYYATGGVILANGREIHETADFSNETKSGAIFP